MKRFSLAKLVTAITIACVGMGTIGRSLALHRLREQSINHLQQIALSHHGRIDITRRQWNLVTGYSDVSIVEQLSLTGNCSKSGSQVSDELMKALSGVKQVGRVDMSCLSLSGSNIQVLARLDLHSLSLSNCELGVEVHELRSLQMLSIEDHSISDRELGLIAGAKQIRGLSLHATTFSDQDLKSIAPTCNRLERLILSDTNISDSSISLLSRCRSLKYLNIAGTTITPMGCDELIANLPSTQIMYIPGTKQ